MRFSVSPPSRIDEGSRPRAAVLLGAGLPAGWCLFDVAFFLTSGDPRAAIELLPGCLALLLAGASFGLVWRRFPWILPVLGLLAVVVFGAPKLGLGISTTRTEGLARALFLACTALGAAAVAERRIAPGALRLGLVAGLLCAMAAAAVQQRMLPQFKVFLPGAAAVLAVGWVRRPSWRWALTSLAVVLPFVPVAKRARSALALPRPDLAPPVAAAYGARPNLLLIVLDTVRADRLGPYGYERETTPALDAFAREHATVFEEVRATSSWTLPSHASMFTGLFPGEHGADHPRDPADEVALGIAGRPARMLPPDVPTLAERLRVEGYRTGAIVANDAYLDHRFGLDRGFERYDDRRASYVGNYLALVQLFGMRLRTGHVLYRDASTISDLALNWLESVRGERPFFLMLNYMDAHQPCFPPAPFDHEFGSEQPADPLRLEAALIPLVYDRALRYIDSEVKRILDWLVAQGLFERTAVIITSDHGEAFGEHGYWTHAWELYEELLRVPLLVKPAGQRLKSRESSARSGADIHDLVLSLAGMRESEVFEPRELAAESYHGQTNPELHRWAERSGRDLGADLVTWIDGEMKYIVGSDASVQAFNLRQDPRELVPVALSEEELERARAKALEWWRAHPPRGGEAPEMGKEEMERLRALGY